MPATGASGVQVQLLPQRLVGPAGMKPLHVDAVGNHADLRRRAAFVRRQVAAVRLGHGDEGVGQRRQQAVGQLHVVGQPVECRAEQITGTPASQAASRPQNILSPPVPTVTTASIRRRRISRASRQSTRDVVLVRPAGP